MKYIKQFIVGCFLIVLSGHALSAQGKLPVGSKAPLFIARGELGEQVDLKALLADGPVIINFYRGQWCQYCNRQMMALQDSLPMITELGATLIAVTPERSEMIAKTREKTNARFAIIPDTDRKIMDSYRVTWRMGRITHFFYSLAGINLHKAHGDRERALPVTATYIIGQDGRVIHAFFDADDHSTRMWAMEMIQVLEAYNQHK